MTATAIQNCAASLNSAETKNKANKATPRDMSRKIAFLRLPKYLKSSR